MQNPSNNALQTGSRGPTVSQLQSRLNTALIPSPGLLADGVFGMRTNQAVRLFQQRRGLTVDGIVGPRTAAALGLSLGGMPGPTPGGNMPPPGGIPPPGAVPPAAGPPGFVDLSMFNVVIEAIIGGYQRVVSRLLSWIDSDYVPQFVYDRVAGMLNGAVNTLASPLRGIARQTVPLGQDPAAFVTGQIRAVLARSVSTLCNALQPLVGLPVIGNIASTYQRILSGIMSAADNTLGTLRSNGQSAQATATRIAGIFDSIARQIG